MAKTTYHFPRPLKKGAVLGIVSPSQWLKSQWFDQGVTFLKSKGFKIVVHPQNGLREGLFAGPDEARMAAIEDLFCNPEVDAILCSRGGTGALRYVGALNFNRIRKHPKPFIGYSDVTVLLHALQAECGFTTYHGPLLKSFSSPAHPETVRDFMTVLGENNKTVTLRYPNVDILRRGQAEGPLRGGNLTLMQHLIGTPWELSLDESLLFIEDVGEPLYKIDRMLRQWQYAGKFKKIRAVLVAPMIDSEHNKPPYPYSLARILEEVIPQDVPLVLNFPCGHGPYHTTLPLGAHARLKIDRKGTVQLTFPTL